MTKTTDFGPLIILFVPPKSCSTASWVARTNGSTLLRWGAACTAGSVGFDSDCFPDGWSGSNSSNILNKAFNPGWGCPDGNWSGWNGQYCTSGRYNLPAHSYLTTTKSTCTTTSVSAYQVGATYSWPTSSSTGGSAAGSSNGGLTTGAKIAIGVCIPVGVIIIAAIVFIWWHRHRRIQKTEAAPAFSQNSQPPADLYTGKLVLNTEAGINPYEKQELDAGNEIVPGKPDAPAKLPAGQVPSTPVAELATAIKKSPDTPQAEVPGEEQLIDLASSKGKADIDGVENGEKSSPGRTGQDI
ncbi:hypothetical protein N7462_010414 [Penicillium macrosclerotiorum]|uniref:uncharacterized protein n=1 Tax=Penicillium macrosclerotiorum TaxID=303699 RepID=UPI0025493EB8|nr:uncharacterized protein N7462_010414 [Penicillium macrosclerotiorum]KAJ5669344.1 hypothetical protein N7462_010414 [Penicillium macrosclerotiorum]